MDISKKIDTPLEVTLFKKTLHSERFPENTENTKNIKKITKKTLDMIDWKSDVICNPHCEATYKTKTIAIIDKIIMHKNIFTYHNDKILSSLECLLKSNIAKNDCDTISTICNNIILSNNEKKITISKKINYYTKLPYILSNIIPLLKNELIIQNELNILQLKNNDNKYDVEISCYQEQLKTIQDDIKKYQIPCDNCFHCNHEETITPSDFCEFCGKSME